MSLTSTLSLINQQSYNLNLSDSWFNSLIPDVTCSYFLSGNPGSGKTAIALQLAKKWLKIVEADQDSEQSLVRFVTFMDLVETARKTNADGEVAYQAKQKLNYIREVPLLILDDIGTEKQTEYVDQLIYDFVNSRYENRKQTVFTSNFSIQEISNKYHPRIASRIIGMCGDTNIISTPKVDYRASHNVTATTDIQQFKPKLQSFETKKKVDYTKSNFDALMKGLRFSNSRLAAKIDNQLEMSGKELSWSMLKSINLTS